MENVLAGFLLAAFLAIAPSLRTALSTWTRDPYRKFYGTFHCCNWRVLESEQLDRKVLTIKRSHFGRAVAQLANDGPVSLFYRGSLMVRGNVLYIDFDGLQHREFVRFVFHEPSDERFSLLLGVFSAVDLDYNPISGRIVVSRTRLTPEDAKRILGRRQIVRVDGAVFHRHAYQRLKHAEPTETRESDRAR